QVRLMPRLMPRIVRNSKVQGDDRVPVRLESDDAAHTFGVGHAPPSPKPRHCGPRCRGLPSTRLPPFGGFTGPDGRHYVVFSMAETCPFPSAGRWDRPRGRSMLDARDWPVTPRGGGRTVRRHDGSTADAEDMATRPDQDSAA